MTAHTPQVERAAQLSRLSDADIDGMLARMRAKTTLPKLDYHFREHGPDFGASDERQYVSAMTATLARTDLRVFSGLTKTSKGVVPRWTLVAPDGATMLYDETDDVIWSFYRPPNVERRMNAMVNLWVELVRRGGRWQIETQWAW